MKTTKVFNVRLPSEWAELLESEAAHSHLKISDLIREMVLLWWKTQLADKFVLRLNFDPTKLTGDSLKKMEYVAEQYDLQEYLSRNYPGTELKDLEKVEIQSDEPRTMHFKTKKKAGDRR